MRSILDLPAHPLFVHLGVVALPAVTIVAVAVLVLRGRGAKWDAGLAIGFGFALFAIWLAKWTGDAFGVVIEGLAPLGEHRELGDQTLWFTAATFVLAVVNLVVGRKARADSAGGSATAAKSRTLSTVAALAALVLCAVVASIWVMRTGHEGARITWDGVFDQQ